MFHMFLNSIDSKILAQSGMRFKKSFKSYSNDQWLQCCEQIWYDREDILHALMSKSKYLW
jgi:hypothetical protein